MRTRRERGERDGPGSLLRLVLRRHYIHPDGISDFLMVDLRTIGNLPNIAGHCDTGYTACPGRYTYAKLPEWRQKVGQRIASAVRTAPLAQITQVPNAADMERGRAAFTWKSPDLSSAEFSYYLEGWLGILETDDSLHHGLRRRQAPRWSSEDGKSVAGPAGARPLHLPRARQNSSSRNECVRDELTFISTDAADDEAHRRAAEN
jgi:hypothetical protein